jgi:hypothetical protein
MQTIFVIIVMIVRYKSKLFDVMFIIIMSFETCQSVKNPRLIRLDSIVVLNNVFFFLYILV